jgi:hypothetical protein
MSIYVEILIGGDMESLWRKTQEPQLHQRWDLRFSEIKYLPRQPGDAQKFLYSTRIGAGLRISGEGESTGEHDDSSGQRTSALKFWSEDPKSLIEFGSGYWKYVPTASGIRFFTAYDYRTRFGVAGRIFDRLLFRPLIGWATAWSFDRLRLWIEQDISPEVSRDRSLIYFLTRLTVAFIWFYHGLVPKLLYRSPDELGMLSVTGMPATSVLSMTLLAGWLEIGFALVFIIFWRARWPLWVTIVAMLAATLGVGISSPGYLHQAFDPLTFNVAVAVLAACGLLSAPNLPTAKRCLRKPPEAER